MREPKPSARQTLRRYRAIARENRRILVLGVILGAVAGLSSGFGVPFFVQEVFRRIFEDSSREYSIWYLAMVTAALPTIFLFRGLAFYGNQYLLQKVCQNILLKVRQQLFQRIQSLPVSYFEKRQSGDLMAKLVGDTLQIQQAILVVAKEAFSQPFVFLAGLGFLIYLSVSRSEIGFILLLIVLAPLMVIPVRMIGRQLQKRSRELQATLGRLSEVMAENLRGIYEVRAFNRQRAESARFDRELVHYNRFAMKMAKYEHLTQPLMEIIAVTMVSLAFVYSYYKQIDFSTFASLGAALFFTVDAVKKIAKMINGVQRVSGAFERIESVLQEPDQILDPELPREDLSFKGRVRMDKVSFQYDDTPSLQNIDLDLTPGTICALVGHSGSGKSTLVKLLLRFYDPQSGAIFLDDVPIRELRKSDLRSQVAFVPQHPVLFNATVADNIALARPDADREAIVTAARSACAHDFISAMENGYDTIVGENAVRLSGGQRQRLALARAFLKNAPVLLLDEATSALDRESEEQVDAAIQRYAEGRTVIIVAHSLAAIRRANWIVLMDQGRIHRQGIASQVTEDPMFQRLFQVASEF